MRDDIRGESILGGIEKEALFLLGLGSFVDPII